MITHVDAARRLVFNSRNSQIVKTKHMNMRFRDQVISFIQIRTCGAKNQSPRGRHEQAGAAHRVQQRQEWLLKKKQSMFRLAAAEGLRIAMSSGNDTSKKNVTWRGGGGGG